MYLIRSFTALSVAALLALSGPDVDGRQQQTRKKGGQHTVRGVVVSVHHGKNASNNGSFTIRLSGTRGKKSQAGTGRQETIRIGPNTQFVRAGTKGAGQGGSASIASLHKGEHVTVTLHSGKGHVAARVAIGRHHKKRTKTVASR